MTTATHALSRRRGDRMLLVRIGRLGVTARVHLRSVAVTIVLCAAAIGVFTWSLTTGEFSISLSDVVATLRGNGSDEHEFIVRTLRLPRALTGLAVGAAFGLSGAIFQRLTGNALASPDIIGVNAGAAVAAVFAIVVVHAAGTAVTIAALAGSALTAITTYLLAYRRGVTGYRLILVGIGVAAVLNALVQYLLTRAEIYDAQQAVVWLTGSLNGRGWDDLRPIAVTLALVVPVVLLAARHIRALELGDDAARGLGVRVERTRAVLLLAGVALAAVATASAGPIGFVALIVPQITRQLVGGRALGLLPAAAGGALLVVAADLVARQLFAPIELPVGLITAILGAPYLLYLIARSDRGLSGQ